MAIVSKARPARRREEPGPALTLPDGLAQLSFAVQSAIGRVAALHDLSLVQLRLLGILRDREPAMLAVATVLNLDKSSVTGLVDRAERRGLVRRATPPEDLRTVRVALTPRGRQLAQKLTKQVARELSRLVAGLSERDRRTLLALASQIVVDDARRRFPEIPWRS
ncbi:MAG TPA: MarR family transcriptional regulator [Polyangia bacterium]|jgi:DNA-binding MarR family transcriptional regulator|nr:MarR family transcriptional regulator [Polyangia bacterium]